MNNYSGLYSQAKAVIPTLASGAVFYLRDLINDPPILMGVWLRRDVDAGLIPGVVFNCKDSLDTSTFKKL